MTVGSDMIMELEPTQEPAHAKENNIKSIKPQNPYDAEIGGFFAAISVSRYFLQ
jgi:hypothetical protein